MMEATVAQRKRKSVTFWPVVENQLHDLSKPWDPDSISLNSQDNVRHSKEDILRRMELPKIIVRDPVTHKTWDAGQFTTYQICIRTKHPAFHLRVSCVRRRFSDFVWLHSQLTSRDMGMEQLPKLPPKRVFADRFSPHFLKRRASAIEAYLNALIKLERVISDNAFHLFVQTDLTTSELNEYFRGSLPEQVISSAWKNMGHAHSNRLLSKPLPEPPTEIVMNEEDSPSSSGSSSPTNISNNNNNNITDSSTGSDSSGVSSTDTINSSDLLDTYCVIPEIPPVDQVAN